MGYNVLPLTSGRNIGHSVPRNRRRTVDNFPRISSENFDYRIYENSWHLKNSWQSVDRFLLWSNHVSRFRGYYPKGGGEVVIHTKPIKFIKPVTLLDPGKVMVIRGRAFVAGVLPIKVSIWRGRSECTRYHLKRMGLLCNIPGTVRNVQWQILNHVCFYPVIFLPAYW